MKMKNVVKEHNVMLKVTPHEYILGLRKYQRVALEVACTTRTVELRLTFMFVLVRDFVLLGGFLL